MNRSTILRAALLAATLASIPGAHAADWNTPQEPFRVYGNTWYVGPHGVSSMLITSPAGHILIDGGTPESPKQIAEHIRQLGFKVEDIRYILNSHEHFDHAGGIAQLQRMSGAVVLGSVRSEPVLRTGVTSKGDPQFENDMPPMTPAANTRVVRDGETVKLGPLAVTAHYTPGHTQGGVSWTWREVEGGKPAAMVYADSLTALGAGSFRYGGSAVYPTARADMEKSIATIAGLECDILISTHPEASGLWERKEKQAAQGNRAFIDPQGCKAYAEKGRARLQQTLAEEAQRR